MIVRAPASQGRLRRAIRRVEVVAICAAAVWTVAGAGATTDGTAPDPTTTNAPVVTPFSDGLPPQAHSVAVELHRVASQLAIVDRARDPLQLELDAAQATLDTTNGFLAQNATDLGLAQATARARAAAVYVHREPDSSVEGGAKGAQAYTSGLQYAGAAAAVDTTTVDNLTALQAKLQATQFAQTQARDQVGAEKAKLDGDRARLTATRDRDQAELDSWGAVPIMGVSTLTPGQIATWYRSTGSTPNLTPGTTIDDLTTLYVEEGATEHVRGDVAFVQAMIETGGFRVAPGNNYAGIGTCDSCNGGFQFPTPRDGVRAQIQLLRNYADPDSRAADLANPPSPGIYGTTPGVAHRYDSFFLKGAAPLWNEMGNGNWATDPVYAPKVTGMYAAMLAYTFTHPA